MSKSTPAAKPNPRGRYFPAELRQRLSDDLHLTGKSKRTHDGYIRAVRQLSDFARCSPDKVTETQVRKFFLFLKNDCHFAYGSLRVALSGVKFFFSVTCKRDWEIFAMLKLQNVKTLPVVLTVEQVHRILYATKTQRLLVFFWTVYTMGLRLNEALHLQVGDIDAARGFVHIHRGKGAKDRYMPLPPSTLRHCYATHLLEAGVGLKVLQKLMGHSSLQSTMVYLHLTDTAEANSRETINRMFDKYPGEDGGKDTADAAKSN